MKFVIGAALAAGATTFLVVSAAFAQDQSGTPSGVTSQKATHTTTTTTGAATGDVLPGPVDPVTAPSDQMVVHDTYTTETRSYWGRTIGAPRKAFELGLSTGYTQGFGDVGGGRQARDIAGPGIGLGLSLGYRAAPGVSIGLSGGYQELMSAKDLATARARGASAGVDVTFHMTPYDRLDLWGSIGTGYRFLWDINKSEEVAGSTPTGTTPRRTRVEDTNVLRHGFELAKVQLGFDVRVSRSVAIGPLVGADVTALLWRDENRGAGSLLMADRGISTFVYGGLGGRFDIGGERVDEFTASMSGR